eukprot:3893949-Pyramimonas_sp.AAC.1
MMNLFETWPSLTAIRRSIYKSIHFKRPRADAVQPPEPEHVEQVKSRLFRTVKCQLVPETVRGITVS